MGSVPMSKQELVRVSSADEVRDLLVKCLKPLIDREKVVDVDGSGAAAGVASADHE